MMIICCSSSTVYSNESEPRISKRMMWERFKMSLPHVPRWHPIPSLDLLPFDPMDCHHPIPEKGCPSRYPFWILWIITWRIKGTHQMDFQISKEEEEVLRETCDMTSFFRITIHLLINGQEVEKYEVAIHTGKSLVKMCDVRSRRGKEEPSPRPPLERCVERKLTQDNQWSKENQCWW